jgi:hypothetical protein
MITLQVQSSVPPYLKQSAVLSIRGNSEKLDTTRLYNLNMQISDGDFGDISSLIIYKSDKLVFEEYYTRKKKKNKPTQVHGLQSATKSIASLLVWHSIGQRTH